MGRRGGWWCKYVIAARLLSARNIVSRRGCQKRGTHTKRCLYCRWYYLCSTYADLHNKGARACAVWRHGESKQNTHIPPPLVPPALRPPWAMKPGYIRYDGVPPLAEYAIKYLRRRRQRPAAASSLPKLWVKDLLNMTPFVYACPSSPTLHLLAHITRRETNCVAYTAEVQINQSHHETPDPFSQELRVSNWRRRSLGTHLSRLYF